MGGREEGEREKRREMEEASEGGRKGRNEGSRKEGELYKHLQILTS